MEHEKLFEIAEQAVDEIRSNATTISPMAFEVWFTHLTELNPALSKDLLTAIKINSVIEEPEVEQIHKKYFANGDLAREVMTVSDDASVQIAKVIEQISIGDNSYKKYSAALKNSLAALNGASDEAGLSSIVNVLAEATGKISDSNSILRKQLEEASKELSTLKEDFVRIKEEAFTDPLTRVGNRKSFDRTMQGVLDTARNENSDACLIFGDVDHFKSFNDTWGHLVGDQVLQLVASTLRANTKGRDLVARYGGEEFALVLPHTDLENAVSLANKLRQEISSRRLTRKTTNELIGHVTISFGVAKIRANDTVSSVTERADKCLYLAKARGRNCVVAESEIKEENAA